MRPTRSPRPAAVATAALTALGTVAMTLSGAAGAAAVPPPPVLIVDNFEYAAGLPVGTDANGVPIGYHAFNGAGSTIGLANPGTPPAPANADNPGQNKVLQLDLSVTSYAGVIHSFENPAVDTWVSQDWSEYAGFTFWLYGRGSNSTLFIDLLENRNPGSIKDDAQRWSVDLKDDFTGWKQLEIPFSSFKVKTVGNGAPTDGFERYEMHGWAIGALGTGGARTYYVDDVGVYGVAPIAPLAVTFTSGNYDVAEGATGDITVKLNRPLRDEDPAQVSVDYRTEPGTATAGREYTPTSGALTFVKDGPRELTFPLQTFDDTKYEGDERVILRLSNPSAGLNAGFAMQAAATIKDNDAYEALLLDDFESKPYLWHADTGVTLTNPEIAASDPKAVPGQGAYEHVLKATTPRVVTIDVKGRVCDQGNGVIPVTLLSTPTFDATTVDPTTVMFGNAREAHVTKGVATKHVEDANRDGRKDLVFHFRFKDTGFACGAKVTPFKGMTYDGQAVTNVGESSSFGRDFAIGQDWTSNNGLDFWYYGQNTGDTVAVDLLDNRAPDPGPNDWSLAWADEFNTAAGTAPDPAKWGYELGDGTANGIPGWGNDELQYYTDSTDNAATDGNGNMVITARAADPSLECYYGPCKYTSARLLSANKAEFAYGRIESRIQVPPGEDGLWPAFWSLGTDINQVGWPQTGEIDFMEYVSRIPDEVFGTIHGPGYAGGESFGNILNIPNVAAEYHTYAIDWEPNLIKWYVDGTLYHTATPADLAPKEWVFNDPVFLLLNMAIGGNFGGAVSPDLTFPQAMKVDYVRVYQGPDTAERFEAPFVDNFTGWQKVSVPFADFTRSTTQPAGAPNDGLGLNEVWGYGFTLPAGSATGSVMLDQVRLVDTTPPTVTITDNVDAETATGDVTFTFAFSENVGTSFTKDDVVLTGGTKGAFTRVDAKHATLVAKPPADTTGTLEVSLAAGAFADLAGNANTSAASAQQAYVTPPLPGGGFRITFDEAGLNLIAFGGAEDSSVVADPTNAANKVLKVVKAAGSETWAGTIVGTEPDGRVPVIPFSASNKTITVRVWSPDAGIPVRLKVETTDADVNVETEATTTVAGAWETLAFDFGNPVGAPVNLAAEYNRVVIFFDFGAAGTGKTYFADDFTFPATGGGGGGGTGPVITFDEATAPVLTGFGGAVGTVMADPTDASNRVAQVIKATGAETWAGVTVSTGPNFSVPVIPLAPGSSTMTARVWSPTAGTPVRLKAEDANDVTHTVETQTLTTVAGAWETLLFDFANEAPGTEPLIHPDWTFSKVSIFFDFGNTGTGATYYLDDLTWPVSGGGGGGGDTATLITFDEATAPVLTGFGGADDSQVVVDPTDAANMVAQVVKAAGSETWAGTTVSTGDNFSVGVIPFSATATTLTARVWSPDAGIPVRLKVENAANSGVSVETEATTTTAGSWETLTFDFANQAAGTAALSLAATYDKVSIFFDFGAAGAGKTYYLDDLNLVPSGGGGGGGTGSVITFDEATAPVLTGFGGAVGTVMADPTDASTMVAQVIKATGAETWAGVTVSTGPNFSVPVIPLAPGSSTMTARVWSPTAGTPVRLKAEDANDVTHTVETQTLTTVAGAWETLVFDFANEAPGTEPLIHPDWTFSKVSIFFDFGNTGTGATYYLDDLTWP